MALTLTVAPVFESVGLTGLQKLHTTKNTKANCYKYKKRWGVQEDGRGERGRGGVVEVGGRESGRAVREGERETEEKRR